MLFIPWLVYFKLTFSRLGVLDLFYNQNQIARSARDQTK